MRLPELPGYRLKELLGEDPFGWTLIATHVSGEHRAVRVLKSQATNQQLIESHLKRFHPAGGSIDGIAPVHDFVLETRDASAAYAMPFYGWRKNSDQPWQLTSLKRLFPAIVPDQAIDVVAELAQSLSNAHKEGVFHGGLRPANCFLTGNAEGAHEVVICDFGQCFMGGLQLLSAGEVLFYVSPEQMGTGDLSGGNGFQWDVYAFGVIAFQLLTGHLPRLDLLFQQCRENAEAINASPAITKGALTPVSEHFLGQLEQERPVVWPDEVEDQKLHVLRQIIEVCLEFDATQRPDSMIEVAEAIDQIDEVVAETVAAEASGQGLEEKDPVRELEEEVEVPRTSSSDITDAHQEEEDFSSASVAGDSGSSTNESAPVVKTSDLKVVEEAVNKVDEVAAGDDQDEGDTLGDRIIGFFADRPTLKWQIAAVASMVAMLPISYFAIVNFFELRQTRAELSVEAAQLQQNVEQQAAAYRKALLEKQRSSEQLESELGQVENSHSRLLGEAKLARQILRQTQEKGDEFFRLVLDNRDTDVPGFREDRADALLIARKHYERLIEVYGDAPDFIVSTANAMFYLGRIYKELGEFGKALVVFGEAERRYLALLDDSDEANVEFIRNLAIAKRSLGLLSTKNGKYAIARHYFTESSRYWTEARSADSSMKLEAGVSIHENSLSVVECELAIGRFDAALDGTRSIGSQLLKLQEEEPNDDRIVSALAHSFALAGRILENQAKNDLAEEAYQEAGDLYARAVKLNAAIDAYQLGLGNSLARVGLLTKDMEKLEAAVEVLGRVVVHNPYESVYQKTLADVYGVLARSQRDGGQLESAIKLEREAIAVLQPIIRESGFDTSPDVLYSYSLRLAHLAELLGDEGEFDGSREPLQEAITILDRISKGDASLAAYQRALARARGLAGFACLKSGDKSEAIEHLEIAKAEWESYVQSNPEDADAEQAVRWTDDQLRSLQ